MGENTVGTEGPQAKTGQAGGYLAKCRLVFHRLQPHAATPHVYADISYILHGDLKILPLLRHTMQHLVLQTRVLYGSDFFVVRNHKSEKNMLADMKSGLLPQEFDLIARKNPLKYLKDE